MKARDRYNQLTVGRRQFLDTAVECSRLTLPYLIQDDLTSRPTHQKLFTPWQSVGSKSVVNLAAKLMLALIPPQTSFFKLQVRDDKLGEEFPREVKSELDLSFAKMERMVMDYVNASSDRVVVHQALKHLIVSGNALIFMGKDGLKNFPLNRFVVNRDGNGQVIEIVTKELISRKLLGMDLLEAMPNSAGDDGHKTGSDDQDVEVYTYVRLNNGRWIWHQECFDKILPNSRSTAPKTANPWLCLRFNVVDGEDYGRGRVEEFLGDSVIEFVATHHLFTLLPNEDEGELTEARTGVVNNKLLAAFAARLGLHTFLLIAERAPVSGVLWADEPAVQDGDPRTRRSLWWWGERSNHKNALLPSNLI